MAVLPDDIQNIDKKDVKDKIKVIYDYIVYLKEQLEFWALNRTRNALEVKTLTLTNVTTDAYGAIYTDLYIANGQYIVGATTNIQQSLEFTPSVSANYKDSNTAYECGRCYLKVTSNNSPVTNKSINLVKIYYLEKKGA